MTDAAILSFIRHKIRGLDDATCAAQLTRVFQHAKQKHPKDVPQLERVYRAAMREFLGVASA